MYTLKLYDKSRTFIKQSNDNSIYNKPDEYNLSFALLLDEEDDMKKKLKGVIL